MEDNCTNSVDHMARDMKIFEEYTIFKDEYNKKHVCCPKCGYHKYIKQTFIGFTVNIKNKENYQDLNRCDCPKCDHLHIFHDRVPILELNIPIIVRIKCKK
jgi:hypothetical protein